MFTAFGDMLEIYFESMESLNSTLYIFTLQVFAYVLGFIELAKVKIFGS